jgi:predicted phosphodiesterase
MFDTSFLPDALFEFVVVTDTHYMLDPGEKPLEFESRRKQSRRSGVALRQIASLDTDLVFHLGDLVQEYPETERFRLAVSEAMDQLEQCGVSVRHVAGNQDIGDKPDQTMPCLPVTPESLDYYHRICGPSWYSFDKEGVHFVILNTQILNTTLEQAGEQKSWLENDLKGNRNSRIFLLLHLPPFLYGPEDPDIGNYDNIGQPDRSWLLGLIEEYKVELMFAAHVHFSFYNRLGRVRFYNVPSPSFTRPGFSHLFASDAPPEQGRDDTPKLGYFLCRVFGDRVDVHLVRTWGAMELPGDQVSESSRLVTRSPRGLSSSPLGLSLLHPIAPTVEIPVAYPSIIRQRVRNDYPLLSCLELGITRVRFPASDLADAIQRTRLCALRDEGVKLIPFQLWSGASTFREQMNAHAEIIDEWEIQIPGSCQPPRDLAETISSKLCVPVSLSSVVPGEREQGKQHPRTRIGFPVAYLEKLNQQLESQQISVDSVLCRLPGEEAWDQISEVLKLNTLTNISRVDISLELKSLDDREIALASAESLFATALAPGMKIYYQPLIDFDRTMDITHGLLDALCNPRPAFNVLRCLNTILFSHPERLNGVSGSRPAPGIAMLEAHERSWYLITSSEAIASVSQIIPNRSSKVEPIRVFDLVAGTVRECAPDEIGSALIDTGLPTLIEA